MARKLEINLDRVVRKAISYIPIQSDTEGAVDALTAYLHSVTGELVENIDEESVISNLEQYLAEDIAGDLTKILDEMIKANKE